MTCTRHATHTIREAALQGRVYNTDRWELCDDGGTVPQPVDDLDCTCRGEFCSIHRPEPTWEEKYDVLEQRIEEALTLLDRAAGRVFRSSQMGQLIQQIGCHLTGRKGSWKPGDR